MNESSPLVKHIKKRTLSSKLASNPTSRHEQELSDQDSDELPYNTRTSGNGHAQTRRPLVTKVSAHEMSDDELHVGTSPVLRGDGGTSKNGDLLRRGENRLINGKVGRTKTQLIDGESSNSEHEYDADKNGVSKLMQQVLFSPFSKDADSDLDVVSSTETNINNASLSATNGVYSSSIKNGTDKRPDLCPTSTTKHDASPTSVSQSSVRSLASQESYSSATMSLVQNLLSTKEARKRGYLVGSVSSGQSMLGASELQRYFPERRMRIYVGTWNMGGMRETPPSLDDLLLPEMIEYAQDAYVIGSQEAISNRLMWELKLQETLGPQYVLFHSGSHGTLHLAIFLRRDIIWFCSESEEAIVTTRAGPSSIKTKGALGVCFKIFGTSFLFMNTHFTAHDERANERIEDYKKIVSGLDLPKNISKGSDVDATARFDYVFWLGDLNSRLQKDRYQVDKLITGTENTDVELCTYDEVVKHDELKMAIDAGLTFHHFQEGRIKFRPTYKYNIGTTEFDNSKKMRTPSYTDRILFRSRKKNTVACLYYDAVMSMCESDHKPVFGLYEVFLRPGIDTVKLSGGQFNRAVWLQGCRQRAAALSAVPTGGKPAVSGSTVCVVS